ncbi:MAG: DUF554 domain-containing protein [Clostridiaceae bacterium]|nr:DUF554 domain-containing protein [Eubacteriales bacterium]
MLGTIVNAAAIAAGGLIGLLLKKGFSKKIADAVMAGIALCVLYIGIDGALKGKYLLAAILSIVTGGIAGTLLDLDGRFKRLGDRIEARRKRGAETGFSNAFVTASLLYCVGAMAILGALSGGLRGDHSILYTKSLLDFISAIVLAATLGAGVAFSAIPVFLYQGLIALLAQFVAPVLNDAAVADMTCVGSLLLIALGLNMLGVTKVKIMNYVPGIFFAAGFSALMALLPV